MEVDRRTLLAAMLVAMSGPKCAIAAAVAGGGWPAFSQAFVTPEGRIVDTGNKGINHSEGQGYGMLLAAEAGDRDGFDRIWKWTDATLARKDRRLFSWRYDPAAAAPVDDPNNASDGDILIAWALQRAARRWRRPAFAKTAGDIRAAIAEALIVSSPRGAVLLPGLEGFQSDKTVVLNLSYYVWPALDAFAKADPSGPWRRLIADGEKLLAATRFGAHGLPCDWISLAAGGEIAPAKDRPPRFGFDAIRIPLYLQLSGREAALEPFRAYWNSTGNTPDKAPAWFDVVTGETAPFPLSQGARAVAALITGRALPKGPLPTDYYAAVLQLLAEIKRIF